MKEIDEENYQWGSIAQTNFLLADIYDMLALINQNTIANGSGKRAKMPKPHPRPHDKEKKTKRIGTAVPISDLDAWLDKKRGEHNGR